MAMYKIWIVINNNSYRNSKYKVYKSETQLIKALSATDKNKEILEFDLISKSNVGDFFTQRERDSQLRAILGELDGKEESAIELVSLYEKLAPVGRAIKRGYGSNIVETTSKEIMLNNMRKLQMDKKAFSALLVRDKRHFFKINDSVDWYKAILKCHNFREDKSLTTRTYNRETKKYTVIDSRTDEMKDNFNEAKKQLRKKK
jgi:hypothetical protein